MFITKLRKSVVCAHEQIVSANVVLIVEWWPVGRYTQCKLPPLKLHVVVKALPGNYGSVMNLCILQLPGSTREVTLGLLSEVAFSVLMEECDVADRSPAIRESSVRIVSWHT